jgi:hypothetical protein
MMQVVERRRGVWFDDAHRVMREVIARIEGEPDASSAGGL